MAKMGRPRKDIDWIQLESLAQLSARLNYCAERQCVKWGEVPDHKTIKAAREVIERRITERYDITFTEYVDEKKEPMRLKLRQKQINVAMDGHPTMLIYLGKVELDQKEKNYVDLSGEIEHKHSHKHIVEIVNDHEDK